MLDHESGAWQRYRPNLWLNSNPKDAIQRSSDTMARQCNHVFVSRASRRAMTRALLLGSWLAASVLSTSAMAQDEREDGPVVQTAEGPVRGFVEDGVSRFLGIPYATPPTGALRWQPPQAPAER